MQFYQGGYPTGKPGKVGEFHIGRGNLKKLGKLWFACDVLPHHRCCDSHKIHNLLMPPWKISGKVREFDEDWRMASLFMSTQIGHC